LIYISTLTMLLLNLRFTEREFNLGILKTEPCVIAKNENIYGKL
jgi:hypothetical protein